MKRSEKRCSCVVWFVVLFLFLLGGYVTGWKQSMPVKNLIEKSKPIQIQLNAQIIEKQINEYIQRRWKNILFHIYFAPDNTAFVHAELKNDYISELFQIPEWFAVTLPEELSVDMQFIPYLQEQKVEFQIKSLQFNSTEMPQMIGDALSVALSERINQALAKEGIVINKLSINGEMLRIETEKSSGQ